MDDLVVQLTAGQAGMVDGFLEAIEQEIEESGDGECMLENIALVRAKLYKALEIAALTGETETIQ